MAHHAPYSRSRLMRALAGKVYFDGRRVRAMSAMWKPRYSRLWRQRIEYGWGANDRAAPSERGVRGRVCKQGLGQPRLLVLPHRSVTAAVQDFHRVHVRSNAGSAAHTAAALKGHGSVALPLSSNYCEYVAVGVPGGKPRTPSPKVR